MPPYESDNDFPIKEFFLFARETGARLGEILHLEWDDVKDGIWHLKRKPSCPTKYGLGWAPKWGKERKVFLSPTAQAVLDSLPKVASVGWQQHPRMSYPANFVFVVRDHKSPEGWRRTDQINKTWRSLLKAAGLPYEGPDKLIRHDLRRTWNQEAQNFRGLDEVMRSQQLGHSTAVNHLHYAGEIDPDMQRLLAKLKASSGGNLIPFLKKDQKKKSG